MEPFPSLATERLILREIVRTDAHALFEINADGDAMKWFGSAFTQPGQALALVETFAGWRRLPNPGTRWGIVRASDSAFLGTCGLFSWNRGARSCVVGFELARSAWGKGYMYEALGRAIAWGFESMQLNRIGAQVHPHNAPSLRLLGKLGFRREGLLREVARWNDSFHDLEQHSLLRGEFGALDDARA